MQIPFVDLKRQYASIKPEIDEAIIDVIKNTSFILGQVTKDFEANFAKYCNKDHAIGVSSGTSALQIALLAMGIKRGDEVITTPNTFIATTEAISSIGASIKFVDIDYETHTIDWNKIKEAITKKTKAIIPVHLYGQPCDMDKIIKIANEYDLKIIEDCAQAHGAEYKDKKVPITELGCFSFYPAKNLGAYGDAGSVVTSNNELYERMILLRDHGSIKKYVHVIEGFNHRIDAIQSAVLNVKLKYLDQWNNSRRNNARIYNSLLENIVETPVEREYAKHVYHLYVIKTKNRDELQAFLKSKGIETGLHYPIPLHLQEAYRHLSYNQGDFPVTEEDTKEILSLPMFAELQKEEIKYVCETIKEFISGV